MRCTCAHQPTAYDNCFISLTAQDSRPGRDTPLEALKETIGVKDALV